jgi:hypothetical protein
VNRLALAIVGGLLGAACNVAPSGGASAPVAGTWQYHASQTQPDTRTVTGTMTLDTAAGGQISGAISANETLPIGGTSPLNGPLTGRALTPTLITFDVYFSSDSSTRSHAATVINGDSLAGSWYQQPGGVGQPSGTFWAKRVTP